MALKTYEITYTDGASPDEVAPVLADGIAFEAHLRAKPSLGKLQDNMILAMAYRAWAALRREGRTSESWNDWMPRVADIELVNEDEPLADDEYALDEAGVIAGKSTPEAV